MVQIGANVKNIIKNLSFIREVFLFYYKLSMYAILLNNKSYLLWYPKKRDQIGELWCANLVILR